MQNQNQLVLFGQPSRQVLQTPQKCLCTYEPQISAYRCTFEIQNKALHPLSISITSTFLHYMELQTNVTQLSAGQMRKIVAKIRPPNQIYHTEFIGISYSFHKYANYLAVFDPECIKATIKLEFDTVIEENQEIDAILREYSETELEQARNLFRLAQYKAAIEKSEEAFTLYRKNLNPLLIMSASELKLGNLQKSTNKIELLMYFPDHPQFSKAALLKIESAFFIISVLDAKNKLAIVKAIMYIMKELLENGMLEEPEEVQCGELMGKLQAIRHELVSKEHNGLFEDFLDRAINDYKKHQFLKENFPTQKDFNSFLQHLTTQSYKKQDETPEYALDPINYQIYMDPVITPTGVSFQKQFLVNFFKKHGPKDPFTREYLDPTSIFSNITLKILVRNHPNLNKWIKYEQEATKM